MKFALASGGVRGDIEPCARAREIGDRMNTPAASATAAADLLENSVGLRRVG
jgi:hypothetical protein